MTDEFMVDGNDAAGWTAQPRQNLLLYDHADVFEAGYGGAAGGGKTDGLLIWQAVRRTQFPGSSGLFLRRKLTDLNQPGAAIARFRELFGARVQYNANTYTATWPNGSVTKFGYLQTDADCSQYQGAQFDDVTFDEVTQFTEYQYVYMFSRARVRNAALAARGLVSQIRCAGNPGGIGHGWFKRRYIDVCWEKRHVDPETQVPGMPARERIFIPSKVTDNYALLATDPYYLANLKNLPEKERRQLLDGDWDIFEGQVFTEWDRRVHVIDPVTPPAHWRRWIGFDWGYAAPYVALFFAEDPDTRQVVVYREVSGDHHTDTEIGQRIMEAAHAENIQYMAADPSIWAKKADGRSTAETLQAIKGWRIRLEPADNDRLQGLRQVRTYLHWEAAHDGTPAVSPLLVIGRNCAGLVATLPELVHDPVKVEDVDTDGADHHYDALRYGLMTRKALWYKVGKRKSSRVLMVRG